MKKLLLATLILIALGLSGCGMCCGSFGLIGEDFTYFWHHPLPASWELIGQDFVDFSSCECRD